MAEAIFSQAVIQKPVPNLIAAWLDKSLLQLNSTREAHSETRYSMLVTIQEFARDRLGEMEDEANIRNWHVTYLLDLADKQTKKFADLLKQNG